MTLEQLLASKGYTQAELEDLKPLLSNAKFRSDLEGELTNGEKALKDLEEYDNWFTKEITPEHEALLKRAADAEAEAAGAKARMEFYQKRGMEKVGDPALKADADRAAADARKALEDARKPGFDPNKYVSSDTFRDAFEKTGDAIAEAQDLVTDFMQYYPGQRLNMRQMREEAKAAKMPVRRYVEAKYKFAEKAKEQEEAAINKRITDAVAKREQELVVQLGGSNPNLAIGTKSVNPFVIKKDTKENKQPWERNENESVRDRVNRAVQKAAERGELARV